MGTEDVEAAGSKRSAPPNEVETPSFSNPVAESNKFSSAADLEEATNISVGLIGEIRKARNDRAIVVLNFRALEALRIDEMQEQLLAISREKLKWLHIREKTNTGVPFEGEESILNENIDALLHKYALALRDYETLSLETVTELVPKNLGVYWTARSILSLLGQKLEEALNRKFNRKRPGEKQRRDEIRFENMLEQQLISSEYHLTEEDRKILLNFLFKRKNSKNNFREVDKAAREARDKQKASSERLWMGSFGGLTLIVPMLIMVRHRSVNGSLIVTSVGTVLFAFALALAARSLKGMDVLAATAAYAAVLVVFVGTSLPPLA